MTSSISNSTDPSTQPSLNLQLGFFTALHLDIVVDICSYFDQQDCLTCMAVCRSWYNMIPEYVQSSWATVRFTEKDIKMENKRQTRCLGKHVKRVILNKHKNEQVLHCLFDWGCTKIEHLEFNQCQMNNHDAFLDALEKLGSHLTHLRLRCHDSNIAFLPLFNTCPELTHFTFNVNRSAWWRYNVYNKEPVVSRLPSFQKTKITHLYLDTYMEKESRIYPIFKSCPDLRSFVGPSKWTIEIDYATQDWQYNDVAIDLDKLLELCPKVNYVRNFYTYSDLDNIRDIDAYTNDQECTGLRYLDICEDYGCGRIAQCLSKNQDTLQYLSIRPYDFYDGTTIGYWWSPLFESLQLTHLTTLVCNGSMSDEGHLLIEFINLCPALETLALGHNTLTIDHAAAHSLSTLNRLVSLDLNSFCVDTFCFTTIISRFPALQELNLTFASVPFDLAKYFHHIQHLKHLTLAYVMWIKDDDNDEGNIDKGDETTTTHFFQYLTAHSQLETIRLAQIPHFGPSALLAIASLPTLKTCDIALQDTFYSDGVLHTFASKLRGTAIEKLSLRTTGYVSYDALTALGDLPLLKELYLSSTLIYLSPCKVDGPGLLELLRRTTSLTSVYFGCVVVSKSKEEEAIHFDNLSVLINQAVPQYGVEDINKRELYRPSQMYAKYYSTVIKRRV
ncbi:hypothetical protein BJV82DRAFT_661580 [Fennellomyces sp. T-0311]|nr:hypothetical protein BJV82DRAFT_661580 [Fennellomyces sp. T-0311]